MFPLPPRPMDTRYGVVTTGCSPLLLLLDVMARLTSKCSTQKSPPMVDGVIVRISLFAYTRKHSSVY
jgi:hypothetical protein